MRAHAAGFIDTSCEWRTIADNDRGGPDPERVGGAANALLRGGGLGTKISSHVNNRSGARRAARSTPRRGGRLTAD